MKSFAADIKPVVLRYLGSRKLAEGDYSLVKNFFKDNPDFTKIAKLPQKESEINSTIIDKYMESYSNMYDSLKALTGKMPKDIESVV